MSHELPHAIPYLRGEASLDEFLVRRKKKDRWGFEGDSSFEDEYGRGVAMKIFTHAFEMLKEHGHTKVVSFGGGKLYGVVGLRAALLRSAREMNLPASVQIIDFSLTKRLAKEGIKEQGLEPLIQDKTIQILTGPIEIRDLKKAEGADVMISAMGPFWHAMDRETMLQTVTKAAMRVAPGGKCFFQANVTSKDRFDTVIKDRLSEYLGQEYCVNTFFGDAQHAFIEIDRDNAKERNSAAE